MEVLPPKREPRTSKIRLVVIVQYDQEITELFLLQNHRAIKVEVEQ